MLNGRVAVIAGASSGIGEAVARRLSENGARVALLARREDRIRALADELDGAAYPTDVTDPVAVAETLDRVAADLGPVGVLVNNAGVAHYGDAADADLADWQRMVDVNVSGVLNVTHAAVHLLKEAAAEQGVADVVTISSASGRRIANSQAAVYSATKHAVGAFSEGLRRELAPARVRVGLVEPGFVRTPLTEDREFGELEALDADDVADAVEWIVTRPARTAINEVLLRAIGQQS